MWWSLHNSVTIETTIEGVAHPLDISVDVPLPLKVKAARTRFIIIHGMISVQKALLGGLLALIPRRVV